MGHPQVKPGILEKGILLRLRFELEQYINLRPVKLYRAQDCPLKDQCLGKNQDHRTLAVGEHHEHLQRRRREQKTEAFQQRMRQRNAIEGTQSELVRAHGLRQARYRSLPKVRLQNYLIGAACNVKRWLAHMGWEIRRGLEAVAGPPVATAAG